ncbi:unnamed protein product [Cunninghamella blakesleeana]
MANIIGQYVQVQLRNKMLFLVILPSIDSEDNSLSLENVKRCFASGRKSDYPFMKVPGHMIQNYEVTTPEGSSDTLASHPPPPSLPSSATEPNTTQIIHPTQVKSEPPVTSNQQPKPTFTDPAIITMVAGNPQTVTAPTDKKDTKSKKQNNQTTPSNKNNKKEIVISIENKKESSSSNKSFKPNNNNNSNNNNNNNNNNGSSNNKPRRNSKIKSAKAASSSSQPNALNDSKDEKKKATKAAKVNLPSSIVNDNREEKKNSVKSPINEVNHLENTTKSTNIPSPASSKRQHVIPLFTDKSSKIQQRKLIETEVIDDYSEFYKTDVKDSNHDYKNNNNHKQIKVTSPPIIENIQQQNDTLMSPPPPTSSSPIHFPMPISPTSVVLTSDNVSPITNSPHLHKPDDAVNQEATQSLLFSLNLKPMVRQPSNPNNILSASSSVFSLNNDSISSSINNESSSFLEFGKSPSSRNGSISQYDSESIRKLSNASDIKVPSSLIPPKLRTRSIKHDYLLNLNNNNVGDNGTPTKLMQPVVDDIMLTATDISTYSDSDSRSMTKTFTLEPQDLSYKEKLQKPMEEEQCNNSDDDNNHHLELNHHHHHRNNNKGDYNDINIKYVKNNFGPRIISTSTGSECPVLTVDHLSKLIKNTKIETGLTDAMIIENAAYATATITFKIIGGQRRVQQGNHNAAPIVVIFAGNHNIGSYGLATARHLANRGIQVIVFIVGHESSLCANVLQQKKCAEFSGAQFVNSIDDLPDPMTAPIDLVIDGLMGSASSMDDLKKDHTTRTTLWQCIDWSNNNKAPVLSLDFPSGVNPKDGHPYHIMHYIQPKWTICFGAPVQGCNSDKITGSLFVADIGIPIVSWQGIGIHGRGFPWGNEFVIPLEYEN